MNSLLEVEAAITKIGAQSKEDSVAPWLISPATLGLNHLA
jgi:hypothetical protein